MVSLSIFDMVAMVWEIRELWSSNGLSCHLSRLWQFVRCWSDVASDCSRAFA